MKQLLLKLNDLKNKLQLPELRKDHVDHLVLSLSAFPAYWFFGVLGVVAVMVAFVLNELLSYITGEGEVSKWDLVFSFIIPLSILITHISNG